MIHISRRSVNPEVLERVFELIFSTLGRRRNKGEFETVITAVFSQTEKIMIGKRMAVYFLLVKNISWTDIAETLKVSISLISKCAMTLQNNSEFTQIIKEMAARDIFSIKMQKIVNNILIKPGSSLSVWKSVWRRKRKTELNEARGI